MFQWRKLFVTRAHYHQIKLGFHSLSLSVTDMFTQFFCFSCSVVSERKFEEGYKKHSIYSLTLHYNAAMIINNAKIFSTRVTDDLSLASPSLSLSLFKERKLSSFSSRKLSLGWKLLGSNEYNLKQQDVAMRKSLHLKCRKEKIKLIILLFSQDVKIKWM